jgi:hypothetical protein
VGPSAGLEVLGEEKKSLAFIGIRTPDRPARGLKYIIIKYADPSGRAV